MNQRFDFSTSLIYEYCCETISKNTLLYVVVGSNGTRIVVEVDIIFLFEFQRSHIFAEIKKNKVSILKNQKRFQDLDYFIFLNLHVTFNTHGHILGK